MVSAAAGDVPGGLPSRGDAPGTDLLPVIEHFVILMKENHSFDNYFGMLGRGDGFSLDAAGRPINSNPDADGHPVLVHHLSSPWQPWHGLDQHWNASHLQWNNGANDGFVRTTGSAAPMGYWTGRSCRSTTPPGVRRGIRAALTASMWRPWW